MFRAGEARRENRRRRSLSLKVKLSLILSALLIFTTLLATGVSLWNYTVKSMQDSVDMNRDLAYQRVINGKRTMEQLESDLFQGYISSQLTELLASGKSEHPDTYFSIEMHRELSRMIHGMAAVDFAVVQDFQGRRYEVSKAGSRLTTEMTDRFGADADRLSRMLGGCLWEVCDGQIAVSRLMYRTHDLRPVGYITVGINGAELSAFLNFDTASLSAYALIHDDGSVFSCSPQLPMETWNFIIRKVSAGTGSSWVQYGGEEYYAEIAGLPGVDWRICSVLTKSHFTGGMRQVIFRSALLAIAACLVAFIVIYLIINRLSEKLNRLVRRADDIAEGRFYTGEEYSAYRELDALTAHLNLLGSQIDKLLQSLVAETEAKHELEYKILESQYYTILAQLNPHFIYNTLETINSVALINQYTEISTLICAFARLFRLTVRRGNRAVLISEEIEYLQTYLGFYELTYPQKISIRFDLDESLRAVVLPSPILQPIVENAIVHGVEKSVGLVHLDIRCYREHDNIVMEVVDDGPGIDDILLEGINARLCDGKDPGATEKDAHMSIGLFSVNRLIRLRYGAEYGISIVSTPGALTRVRITLPLERL